MATTPVSCHRVHQWRAIPVSNLKHLLSCNDAKLGVATWQGLTQEYELAWVVKTLNFYLGMGAGNYEDAVVSYMR